jgi:acyl-CoA thioester hydrolase
MREFPEPEGFVQVHHIRVRFAETDQQGVAHHSTYIPWIEEGRTEWLRASGRTYRSMEASGLILTVMSVVLRYRAAALYDDMVRIETWLSKKGGASLTFHYRLSVAERDGEATALLIAEAETRLGLVDGEGRPQRLPSDILPDLDCPEA